MPAPGSRRNARRIIRVGHVLCPPRQIRARNSSRMWPVLALSCLLWNKMNTITEPNFYQLLLSSIFTNACFRADKENTFNISIVQRIHQLVWAIFSGSQQLPKPRVKAHAHILYHHKLKNALLSKNSHCRSACTANIQRVCFVGFSHFGNTVKANPLSFSFPCTESALLPKAPPALSYSL